MTMYEFRLLYLTRLVLVSLAQVCSAFQNVKGQEHLAVSTMSYY